MEDAVTDGPERHASVAQRVSRRTLMKTGAGVGIAAAVATAGVAYGGSSSSPAAATKPTGTSGAAIDGALVVHVIDASSGTVEVFTSAASKRIKDHDLVARIARAARG